MEDEVKLASLIRRGLKEHGLSADVATKGEDALWMAGATAYGAIVLDLMLPGIDGFETCRRLRDDGVLDPVLMLTARDARRRSCGRAGQRRRRLPRRSRSTSASCSPGCAPWHAEAPGRPSRCSIVGTCSWTPPRAASSATDAESSSRRRSSRSSRRSCSAPAQALSRLDLLEHAWDSAYENRSNVVDVYVRYLRDKIDRPFGTDSIETVRGVGYRLRDS